ncbi:response regulator transcription factor [Inquilinus sp. OTU3971]|uniref:response regulator transcription factor n=1 Tax=Inquilinus sp. OTU3971 TaxID=3043855 RepID=UPI00313C7A96
MPSKPKILVVDDDELLRDLLEFRLRSRGYEVELAEDGEAALEAASASPPDLIVLDGMMPGLDGFQVLQRLSDNDETRDVPVIMLTARRQEQDVVAGLSLGAQDYLVKPFLPDELLLRIQRILRSRQRPS